MTNPFLNRVFPSMSVEPRVIGITFLPSTYRECTSYCMTVAIAVNKISFLANFLENDGYFYDTRTAPKVVNNARDALFRSFAMNPPLTDTSKQCLVITGVEMLGRWYQGEDLERFERLHLNVSNGARAVIPVVLKVEAPSMKLAKRKLTHIVSKLRGHLLRFDNSSKLIRLESPINIWVHDYIQCNYDLIGDNI